MRERHNSGQKNVKREGVSMKENGMNTVSFSYETGTMSVS